VSWSSRLQPVVSLSTTEAEYIAAVEAGKEIIWMRNLLTEFGFDFTSPSPLLIDNNSAVSVAKNPEHHGCMKHLDLRFHWLRDTVEAGHISPIHVPMMRAAQRSTYGSRVFTIFCALKNSYAQFGKHLRVLRILQ
jgi:hypothetical protein